MGELYITQTRHRHKMATEAGKLHKWKIERDECKGTCNGPVFLCNITFATGLQARTSFAVTIPPSQHDSLRLWRLLVERNDMVNDWTHGIGTKWQKKQGNCTNEKIERDECKGTRNGPFFGAKITLATGLQARTSFPVTVQPAKHNGLRLRRTRSNPATVQPVQYSLQV